jgi:predicted RNA-binding protein YlxR (DUF448 family)
MPNKSSNKGHHPIRTCVICREKKEKHLLLRFETLNGELVIDCKNTLLGRGSYLCDDNDCYSKLDKWLNKRRFKRVKNESKK